MSLLVSLWILLVPCLSVHIAHTGARRLLEEVDRSVDMMKKFDPSGKTRENIKLNPGDPNYTERRKTLLASGEYNEASPSTTMMNKLVPDESPTTENANPTTENANRREGYSTIPSTKLLFSFSRRQQTRKSQIDRSSSPGIFSDYSRPRMRAPSHNR